jgi:hypothetical protein
MPVKRRAGRLAGILVGSVAARRIDLGGGLLGRRSNLALRGRRWRRRRGRRRRRRRGRRRGRRPRRRRRVSRGGSGSFGEVGVRCGQLRVRRHILFSGDGQVAFRHPEAGAGRRLVHCRARGRSVRFRRVARSEHHVCNASGPGADHVRHWLRTCTWHTDAIPDLDGLEAKAARSFPSRDSRFRPGAVPLIARALSGARGHAPSGQSKGGRPEERPPSLQFRSS